MADPGRGTDSTYFWLKILIRMPKMFQVSSKANIYGRVPKKFHIT